MEEEAVEPQENVEIENEIEQDSQEVETKAQETEKQVPLSALMKERRKKQEIELELQWERQRNQRKVQEEPVEDTSHEPATRGELSQKENEILRKVEESIWIKQNPEKYEHLNEYLPQFLKQRPNLAHAINSSSNRYEEAYTLMDALTPKQKGQMKMSKPKADAPSAPTSVPKSSAMNQSIDVMGMSDVEFAQWRKDQKRRR